MSERSMKTSSQNADVTKLGRVDTVEDQRVPEYRSGLAPYIPFAFSLLCVEPTEILLIV